MSLGSPSSATPSSSVPHMMITRKSSFMLRNNSASGTASKSLARRSLSFMDPDPRTSKGEASPDSPANKPATTQETSVAHFLRKTVMQKTTDVITEFNGCLNSRCKIVPISMTLMKFLRQLMPCIMNGFGGFPVDRHAHEPSSLRSSSDAESLVQLYYLVQSVGSSLPLSKWTLPKLHRSFRAGEDWSVYILKVHQIVTSCMIPTNDHDNFLATMEEKSGSQISTNCFETKSLWLAALNAARSYEGNRPVSASVGTLEEVSTAPSTSLPSANFVDVSDASNEASRESTVTVPGAASKAAEPAAAQPVPMALYWILLEGASDYIQVDTPESADEDSTSGSPNNEAKTVSDSIAFVQASTNQTACCIVFDLDLTSFDINSCGRYDAYMLAVFLELVLRYQDQLKGWTLLSPAIFKRRLEGGGRRTAPSTSHLNLSDMTEFTLKMIHHRATHGLRVFRTCVKADCWGLEKYEYLCHMLLSSSTEALENTIKDLVAEVWHAAFHRDDVEGLERLESLLVSMLGHPSSAVRGQATILLNMFYDKHDWQYEVPFVPFVKQVGDSFDLCILVDDAADPSQNQKPEGIFLICSSPSYFVESPYEVYSYHAIDWKPACPTTRRARGGVIVKTATSMGSLRHKWSGTVKFPPFGRCGFYDWRVVRLHEDFGSWETVLATIQDIRHSASNSQLLDLKILLTPSQLGDTTYGDEGTKVRGKVYPHPECMAELAQKLLNSSNAPHLDKKQQTFPLQGRFIVQPRSIKKEQFHEIFIDHQGLDFDSAHAFERGSFASIAASLPSIRQSGITACCLTGSLSRDLGKQVYSEDGGVRFEREHANPFAITCRSTPNALSGGMAGALSMMKEAKRVGMKMIFDATLRVSSSRPHRKYVNDLLHFIDEGGRKAYLYGTSGRSVNFEDTCYLNYRKVSAWNSFISDLKSLASAIGIHGFRIENADTAPVIFDVDWEELRRLDPDGVAHYSVIDQSLGGIVATPISPSGFWETPIAQNWSNPFFIKCCREVWKDHPHLILLGDCQVSSELGNPAQGMDAFEAGHERHSVLVRSGIIPVLSNLSFSLSRLYKRAIVTSPSATLENVESSTVQELINWFEYSHSNLPEGAIIVQASCSEHSPLPALLYGQGAWAAVDLLFFLPDIPMTHFLEVEGRAYRLDLPMVYHMLTEFQKQQKSLDTKETKTDLMPLHKFCQNVTRFHPSAPILKLQQLSELHSFQSLAASEKAYTNSLGPKYGFDLRKIYMHYVHRRQLRHRFKIFTDGVLVPITAMHEGKWNPKIICFIIFDFDSGEFVLIGINFTSNTYTNVEASVLPLAFQFRNMGLRSDSVFLSGDILALSQEQPALWTQRQGSADQSPMQCPASVAPDAFEGCPQEPQAESAIGCQFESQSIQDIFASLSQVHDVLSLGEIINKPTVMSLPPYGSECVGFWPTTLDKLSPQMVCQLYQKSLSRLEKVVKNSMTHVILHKEAVPTSISKSLKSNFVLETLIHAIKEQGVKSLAVVLMHLQAALTARQIEVSQQGKFLHELMVNSGLFVSISAQEFDVNRWKSLCFKERGGAQIVLNTIDEETATAERFFSKLEALIALENTDGFTDIPKEFFDMAKTLVAANDIGPIVFITTELGRWSSVGGLGVMVDELSCTLATYFGQQVYVLSPYYHYDKKGNVNTMDPEHSQYKYNVSVDIAGENIQVGVHKGSVRGVNLIFLHNERFFPKPYPDFSVPDKLRYLTFIGKACLEVLCQEHLIPQLIVTNDWPTGLLAAYGKNPYFFGDVFSSTTFFHIVHNLDADYEGRIYANRSQNHGWITELSQDLLVDPLWSQYLFNPSRCMFLTCDAWGTVSPSYRDELRKPGGSALAPLLNRYPTSFAYPNGISLKPRLQALENLQYKTHKEAKVAIQKKYFQFESSDTAIPLFAFIGRITEQKGIHLILDAAEQLIHRYQSRIQILVGGRVSWNDSYSAYCGHKMKALKQKYPYCFWAEPDEFFTDGTLVNLGADVGLMPSRFEPGGIVQHEFFIAGTPVLAFSTGGLKDTVFEFDVENMSGNGFTFEAYQLGDFLYAMERAYRIVKDPSKYFKLRKNASLSVISCEQAAQAWLIEFSRLRRKIPVNSGRVNELASKLIENEAHLMVEPLGYVKRDVWIEGQGDFAQAAAQQTDRNASMGEYMPSLGSKDAQIKHRKEEDGLTPHKIRFTPRGPFKPHTVAISGSFDNWQVRRPMTWDHAMQTFTINLALRPGTYRYKLIVDGDWEVNPDDKSEHKDGITNNYFTIA